MAEEPMEVDQKIEKYWKIIGKLLKVEESDLNRIEQTCKDDVNACMREMLSHWRASNPANPEEKLKNAEMQVSEGYHQLESR